MSEAKKTASGKWCNRVYAGRDENGKNVYVRFYGDSKAEANAKAAQFSADRERGIRKETHPSQMTVGEAIDRYIGDQTAVLSPKTIREYKQMRRNHLQELMDVKISILTTPLVQHAINTDASTVSPKTVRNVYALFTASIRYVSKEITFDVNLPQPRRHEMTIPTAAEFTRLLDAVRDTSLEVPVLLAATCGLRRGEIIALDLNEDVDYDSGTIRVNKALCHTDDGAWVEKPPKTIAGNRTVKAPTWVVERLRELAPTYHPLSGPGLTCGWMRMADKLGIGDVRFHDLRHYYASALLAMGVPDKYAMARTGHSTTSMLKNVYQHLMDTKDDEVNAQTEEYFSHFAPAEYATKYATSDNGAADSKEKKRNRE